MWVKDYLEKIFPEKMSGEQLRAALHEAWKSITQECLDRLIDSMQARCQAVIDANGGHTEY